MNWQAEFLDNPEIRLTFDHFPFFQKQGIMENRFSFDYQHYDSPEGMPAGIMVFVVLGGLGNMWGSVIAAAALTILPEALRQFSNYRMLVYAIVLILVMLATNNPTLKGFFSRLFHRVSIENIKNQLGMVAGVCNPSYLRR